MRRPPVCLPDFRPLMFTVAVGLLLLAATPTDAQGPASIPPGRNSPLDFSIKRQWLEDLRAQKTFLPTFRITRARSAVHESPDDCEMHLAGTMTDSVFADPRAGVVAPPNLKMWVRYDNVNAEDQYEFFQDRPANCGSFVIVEVSSLPQEWIQVTSGGQTAIGRVTANGSTTITSKLYAVEGTSSADWFARHTNGGNCSTVRGLSTGCSRLTYDDLSMIRAIGDEGSDLPKAAD
jgi:hypothetical protein